MRDPHQGLDDPDYARFAWARFRRILGGMAVLGVVCGVAAVGGLYWWLGMMPLHMGIATFLGVALSVLVGGLLMGLVFLSSGSGHDESVDRLGRDRDRE